MPSDASSVKKILSSKYTAIVILLIVSIGVYLNALPNEFVYDDEDQVLKNLWIRDVKHIPEVFLSNVWAFEGEGEPSNYYRPFMHITYMIDYHIFGLKPWGFHLTNIIFHAGVTLLVYLIASMLINQYQILNHKSQIPNSKIQNPKSHPEQVGTKSQISSRTSRDKSQILNPPFIAALLFAAHPIHTEAVTWVGGIPELSFTLFYLLSFYFYINSNKRYTPLNPLSRGENKNKRWGKGIILSVLFFFLAALCKEPALTLPLLLLAYDYSISRSSVYSSRFTVHSIIKRYLPFLIASGVYFILRTYALGEFAPLKRHAELSNYEYFINIFPLFTQYLEKLLLPINMNAFYVLHPISSLFEWKGIITFTLTLTFISLIYFFKRNRMVYFSLLWIVIPLLPVLYIPALGENTFTDRYLYLPSIGFVVLGALAIERVSQLKALRQTANYVVIPILVILTGLYSIGTIKRNYIWRDSYSLWTDTVEKSPDGYIPHNNAGNAYYKKGEIDKAFKHYQIAQKLMPDSRETHTNIGSVYAKQGRFDEAIKEYMIALRLKPDYADAHNNLGNVYYEQQRFEDAIKEYMTTLRLKPNYAEAHYNLGNIYLAQGRFDEAIKEYLLTLELRPRDADAYSNIGNAYSAIGKFEEARREYLIALRLNPEDAGTHYNIGNTYFEQRRFDDAIKEYMFALKLKPDYYETHYNLGLVYLEKGLRLKAQEEFTTVLKLNPDFVPAKEALELINRER